MKPKPLRLVLALALLFTLVGGVQAWLSPGLSQALLKVPLKNGKELRVLKVSYGHGIDHENNLGGPSAWQIRLKKTLPMEWRNAFPEPGPGVHAPMEYWCDPKVSVWVAILAPGQTYRPPSSQPLSRFIGDTTTVEGGEEFQWKGENEGGIETRQLIFWKPRGNPREFEVSLPIADATATLKIPNPAYRKP